MKVSNASELLFSSSFHSFLSTMQVTVDNYPPKKLDDNVHETGRLIKVSRNIFMLLVRSFSLGSILFQKL